MKKLITIAMLLVPMFCSAQNPGCKEIIRVNYDNGESIYEYDRDDPSEIIADMAYALSIVLGHNNDSLVNGDRVGSMQISEHMVDIANEVQDIDSFCYNDRYDYYASEALIAVLIDEFDSELDIEKLASIYDYKLPNHTIAKIKKVYKDIRNGKYD